MRKPTARRSNPSRARREEKHKNSRARRKHGRSRRDRTVTALRRAIFQPRVVVRAPGSSGPYGMRGTVVGCRRTRVYNSLFERVRDRRGRTNICSEENRLPNTRQDARREPNVTTRVCVRTATRCSRKRYFINTLGYTLIKTYSCLTRARCPRRD